MSSLVSGPSQFPRLRASQTLGLSDSDSRPLLTPVSDCKQGLEAVYVLLTVAHSLLHTDTVAHSLLHKDITDGFVYLHYQNMFVCFTGDKVIDVCVHKHTVCCVVEREGNGVS